ncbi:MAG: ribonuclease [Clostridia bacterium]|nr:ribonuclease [Clostridia bacterium]
MNKTKFFARWLALLLASVLALTGCGAVGDLVEPYEEELGELGSALLDQLLEVDATAEDTTVPIPETTTAPKTTKAPETTQAPITTKAPETTQAPVTTKAPETTTAPETTAAPVIDRDGSYTSKEDVALYLKTYGELPSNFITKSEAQKLGWVSSKGNLHDVAPGKSIGGDKFGNYEGLLPKKSGRQYYECDIDYTGGFRDSKRIVYSNDGLIYYTDDHYETFTEIK